MKRILGIRREDKNQWERRAPLTPQALKKLREEHGISFYVQPSAIRVFPDAAFRQTGAVVQEDLSCCDVIIAVKEIPAEFLLPEKTYMFFSHTIKGQPHNMAMLKRLVELKCNLIDYELITDAGGKRLVSFSFHAGLAGMISGLWALGERLKHEGIATAFEKIRQAKDYASLEQAKQAVRRAGEEIAEDGLPAEVVPMIVGFAGHGNVSQGAQQIFDELPYRQIEPQELSFFVNKGKADNKVVYKVVLEGEDIAEPIDPAQGFDLQDYHLHPEKYRSIFARYLPNLTYLVNCIFWRPGCPRLVTKNDIRRLYSCGRCRLRGITDISCDIEGSVECLVKCTDPGNPTYVYLPDKDAIVDGFCGQGPVMLAVDTIAAEIPLEASTYFSGVLTDFVPEVVSCDFSAGYDDLSLSGPLKKALVLHNGSFTPAYKYMENL